jgi:hypothetical protein
MPSFLESDNNPVIILQEPNESYLKHGEDVKEKTTLLILCSVLCTGTYTLL